MYRPYPPRWITKKNDSFRLETHSSSPSSSTHSAPGSRFLYFCMAMESGGRKNLILPQKDAKMAQGVNPRSRLIHFSKNSSFHYFTVDEMGLRLMKLTLDETMLYRFQRYLQQNGHLQSIYASAVSVQSGAAFGGVCLEKGEANAGRAG